PSLTAEQVRWIAHLARLELSDAELATMTRQLGAILDYVAQLQQVDTEGVEPLAHALDVHNVFREDVPAPSLPAGQALANPPRRNTPRPRPRPAPPPPAASILPAPPPSSTDPVTSLCHSAKPSACHETPRHRHPAARPALAR